MPAILFSGACATVTRAGRAGCQGHDEASMEFLTFSSLDPAFNLALEERLFDSLPPEHPGLFMLWQNGPSIIVGRHQCTAEEVNADFVRRENLPVVRRITGGGAVYHDTGNLNFSFIENANGQERVNFRRYLEPVREALRDVGVRAEISGRNDLEVDGRKISGSGQRIHRGKVLHHGTLLVDVDFGRLSEALSVDPEKIRSKGVASVRARVRNLSECWTPGTDMGTLKCCLLRHCAASAARLDMGDYAAAQALADSKYRQWSWNYGASPAFTEEKRRRFPWGGVNLRLSVRNGRIADCRIYGDFFANAEIEDLENMLAGLQHEPGALAEALEDVPWELYFSGCDPEEMRRFFAE